VVLSADPTLGRTSVKATIIPPLLRRVAGLGSSRRAAAGYYLPGKHRLRETCMPYEWVGSVGQPPAIDHAASHGSGAPPLVRLHLWPHRSLPKRGFVLFIGATFGLVLLPLIAVLGTPVLWGLLPFVLGTLALTWGLLQKSYRDGEILEELTLWSDHATLIRQSRGRDPQSWDANPFWVSVQVHKTGGPVESYLTLKGAGREVELGAFLSKDEREALYPILGETLSRVAATASALT
jgi:uncharacterized membrane protein